MQVEMGLPGGAMSLDLILRIATPLLLGFLLCWFAQDIARAIGG